MIYRNVFEEELEKSVNVNIAKFIPFGKRSRHGTKYKNLNFSGFINMRKTVKH